MKLEELEMTSWAKSFNECYPNSYQKALTLALTEGLEVKIIYAHKECDFRWGWAIISMNGFFMDVFETMDEAITLCLEMGWKIL